MTTSTPSKTNNSNNTAHHEREERATAASTTYTHSHHSPTESGSGVAIGSTNRVMQADEDFNIRFVNLVRNHKCIYDKKVPEYRNRDNQEKAWLLISKETRESVIHCKERWRNLRACLSRYIKQQSGSEPQHKPYYLTEHMAFLLPFLKSTRNSLEGNTSLAALYHLSQQHQRGRSQNLFHPAIHGHDESMYCSPTNNNNHNRFSTGEVKEEHVPELKHSRSENGDDEETIDAFDPAVANALGLDHSSNTPTINIAKVTGRVAGRSPTRSDTASADSMQNFIPDVQLAESGSQLMYNDEAHETPPPLHYHPNMLPNPMILSMGMEHRPVTFEPTPKRIKMECEATSTMTNGSGFCSGLTASEMADMEFFRSILPDLAALTGQQRRKFKIGILELIDDVITRYPSREAPEKCSGENSGCVSNEVSSESQPVRRCCRREWQKQ
ncbi:hypothetical protein KR032_010776 [Drosophila birchii]|nr:hypothetical protein KR032_010776 [Drosophila birchii]